jgi:hypothetical protein
LTSSPTPISRLPSLSKSSPPPVWPGSSEPRVAGISMISFSDAGSIDESAPTVKREMRLNQFSGSPLSLDCGDQ